MAAAPLAPVFTTDFVPHTGEPVSVAPGLVRISASNSGPYTFTGTNSFILGYGPVAVIDPGPDDDAHLAALMAGISGRAVEAIILTHTHKDHSSLAAKLKAATGAPLWFEGRHRLSRKRRLFEVNTIAGACDWDLVPDRFLGHGERFTAGGVTLEAVATPGHCANHVAFGMVGTPYLLTGDHIMGWSSTLVSVPDGSMADYFASIDRVLELPYVRYLPAHGGPIADGPTHARALRAHREMRNRQIVEAIADGARRVGNLVDRIYPTLGPALRIAARMTLAAHIEYLEARREIVVRRTPFGIRLRAA